MIWMKNCLLGVYQQSLTQSLKRAVFQPYSRREQSFAYTQ